MVGPRVAFKTAQNSFPAQGNREIPIVLDFTNVGTILDDLTPEQQASEIDTIQAVYIDNSNNQASLIITVLDTQQVITAQPLTQGIYPIISRGQFRYKAVTSQGQKVQVIFSNSVKDHCVWGPVPGVTVVPPLTNIPVNLQPGANGDNNLIAGVANQTIKIYRMILMFGAGVNAEFFSGPAAGANNLSGIMNMFAGGSITMQPSGIPWMTCAVGAAFNLNLSAAVNVGGILGYTQS